MLECIAGRRAAAHGNTGALKHILESLRTCLHPALMDAISPWQVSSALPSKPHELHDLGVVTPPDLSSWPDSLRGAEADFFEGNRGGGPIYPRSGMREHAAQSLCYIAQAVVSSTIYGHGNANMHFEAEIMAPLVADVAALIAADKNRFSHGWASEALRRLAQCSPSAQTAFNDFLRSARWKPAQMQLELGIEQRSYGSDPLMPSLLGP